MMMLGALRFIGASKAHGGEAMADAHALQVNYTKFTNLRGRLSKRIEPKGHDFKKISTTSLFDGEAERIRLAGCTAEEALSSLAGELESMPSNQAIALGVFADATLTKIDITTQNRPRDGAIPRIARISFIRTDQG
jgi:hypothetical protein